MAPTSYHMGQLLHAIQKNQTIVDSEIALNFMTDFACFERAIEFTSMQSIDTHSRLDHFLRALEKASVALPVLS